MNEQTLSLIQQLAEKLGTTTEYLFSILILQAKVTIFQNIFFIILFLVSTFFMFKIGKVRYKNMKEEYEDFFDGAHGWILAIWAIINAIWFFGTISIIIEISTCIANPEYWAIQQILKQINQ